MWNCTVHADEVDFSRSDCMKLLSKIGLVAVAGLLVATGVGQAQEMKFWRIGTGGAGGTYFPFGAGEEHLEGRAQ